jgi:hypothetical protein
MKFFNAPTTQEVKYQVIEVEKPRPILDPEFKNAIPSLQGNPGFIYLLNKLRLEHAKLEKYLKENRHADLRSVDFVQSGLFWTSWLQDQLTQSKAPVSNATSFEAEAFSEAQVALDLVGSEDPHKG